MKEHDDAYERLSQEADGLRTQVQELQTTKGTLVDELQGEALADQAKVTFLFLLSSPTSSLTFIVVLKV